MTQQRRVLKEIVILKQNNYQFQVFNNNQNLVFFSNYGQIQINIPSSYPFSTPKIYILNNLEKLGIDNKYLDLYLNKLFPTIDTTDIIETIKKKLFNSYNDEKIHIKKFFYDNIRRYNDKDCFDIILSFDKIIEQGWNPAFKIIDVLKLLEYLNQKYNIKDKYKFKLFRNLEKK
jgi:ubiquitin-protein ligase